MKQKVLVRIIHFLMLGIAAVLSAPFVQAADYPDRPIKLIVPFPPGGSTDVIARLLAQEMSNQLSQKVIVENKAGASGAIATQALAKAEPNGYTLCYCTTGSIVILPLIDPALPYKPEEVVPITHMVDQPFALIVRSTLEVNNFKDFIAYAKKNPGKITFGSPGTNTPSHLTGELLNDAAKINIVHVPYRGDQPAVADLLGGQIDAMFTSAVLVKQLLATGKVKALAVSSKERLVDLPDIPTIAQEGYPGFSTYNFGGLFAPAKTPPDIIKRLHEVALAAMQSPTIASRIVSDGLVIVGSNTEVFQQTLKAEQSRWGSVAKASSEQK